MDEDVSARLVELRSVTPDGAQSLMNAFETTCEGYFNRGATFTQLLFDAFMGHMFDQFMSDFRSEHHERLPSLRGGVPTHWNNIKALFKGEDGEIYPFNGMLNVSLTTFRNAYVFEGGGDAGPSSGGGVWRNDLLTGWMLGIEEAQAREERELDAIKEYALRRYEPWSPPLLNDDLGWRRQMWGNRCYILMLATFVEKQWGWVYEVFELNGSEPEFLKELCDEDDG